MLKNLSFLLVLMFVVSCSHNPHKAEKIETEMEKKQKINDSEVGVKDGNMVIQRKTLIAEELRDLQIEVYGLEDKVYGNQKYGSLGTYGLLKKCRLELSKKENGGAGKLIWTEPLDRVTDKEEDLKIGLDEKGDLVAVSEEFLKDRIARFREYKRILLKREKEYDDKLEVCESDLRSKKFDQEKESKSND